MHGVMRCEGHIAEQWMMRRYECSSQPLQVRTSGNAGYICESTSEHGHRAAGPRLEAHMLCVQQGYDVHEGVGSMQACEPAAWRERTRHGVEPAITRLSFAPYTVPKA